MTIQIKPDGTLVSVATKDLDLRQFGDIKYKRASHVLPVNSFKRLLFMLLRLLFGERGRVAEWTRQWYGPWKVIIIGTCLTYTTQSRKAAIDWEVKQLNRLLEQ